MGRAGLRKGLWTPEEDKILIKHIEKHGCGMWTTLAKQAGLLRCGKSCRLRWKNYLNPDIKRGPFTFEEEKLVFQLQALLGNRWSTIATHLPGRTDNDIKNLWSRLLKKRSLLDLDPTTQDSTLSLGLANQAPASPTTGVMSQWESATTLEPEARLPGDLMPFTPCDNLFDIWNSEVVESFSTTLAPWDDESTSCQIPFSRTASSSSALLKSSTNSCGSKEVAMASCSSPCTKDDDSSDSALQLLLDSPLIGGDDDMAFLEDKMSLSPAVGF